MAQQLALEPYGNTLIVILEEKEKVTPGGIILTEKAAGAPVLAKVIAVGTGQKTGPNGETIPCLSKVGDRIVINKFGAKTIEIAGGVSITIINEGDVYARFTIMESEDSDHDS